MSGESGKLRCYAHFTVKEGEEETFLTAVTTVIENSKRAPGCVSSLLHKEKDGDGYAIIEEWESEEDCDRDNQCDVVKDFLTTMGDRISMTYTKLQPV